MIAWQCYTVFMSALILKIIAMITMTIDHIGEVFSMPSTYRMIGRIAFPLYALMVIDGYRHIRHDSRRLERYAVFLLLAAVISEPLHDLCFYGTFFSMEMQNQILQFLIFIVTCVICERIGNKFVSVIIWLAVIYLNSRFAIGYFGAGIVFMLMLNWYLELKERNDAWYLRLFLLLTVAVLTFGELFEQLYVQLYDFSRTMYYVQYYIKRGTVVLYTFLAFPFMAMYDGTYGNISPVFKIIYRWYYPVHLLVLALIHRFL